MKGTIEMEIEPNEYPSHALDMTKECIENQLRKAGLRSKCYVGDVFLVDRLLSADVICNPSRPFFRVTEEDFQDLVDEVINYGKC